MGRVVSARQDEQHEGVAGDVSAGGSNSRAKGELDPEDDVVTAILGDEPAYDGTDHWSQERREREDTSCQCAFVTATRVSRVTLLGL